MSDLPAGWAIVPLAEVIEHKSGNSKLIKGKLSDARSSEAVYPGFSASGQDIWLSSFEHEGNAIIISAVGARCGKCFLATGKWSAIANTHIARPSTSCTDIRFFWYLLNNEKFWVKGGSAQPFVKVAATFERAFNLPPLKEQKRIAQKLDTLLAQVDTLKARIDAIPNLLKRFRHATLSAAANGDLTKDWREAIKATHGRESAHQYLARILEARSLAPRTKFKPPVAPDTDTRNIEVPATWIVSSVSTFAECLDSMRVPVKKELRARDEGIYPYFGANGEVDRVNEFIFDDDLVLVTEDETFYGRVKPIAYKYSGKCWVNNHVHVLRAHDKVGQSFLCYILMHYDVTPWLTGTTGRAKLTQGALMALPIGVPPPDEQAEIVRRTEKLFAFADQLEARVSAARVRIDALTQSLLAKAFRGELVPQDPSDEPANVLLERIRAQRAATPKPKRGRKAETS